MKRITSEQVVTTTGNRYNRQELAGAFGDLSTMIPFVLAYINLLHFNPAAILFGFGLTNIIVGWFFKTPIPVQPMKAIGTAAILHVSKITPGVVWGAGLFSGVFWLVLGYTGVIKYIMKVVKKPVSAMDFGQGKKDVFLLFVTAGFTIWNAGAALLVGIVLSFFLSGNIFSAGPREEHIVKKEI